MSFNIKDKLFLLISNHSLLEDKDYKYSYSFKIRTHLLISSFTFMYYYIPSMIGFTVFERGHDMNYLYILGFFVVIPTSIFYINSFVVSILQRKNIFKFQKDRLCAEKDFDNEFGSVDRVLSIYKEIKDLKIELTDQNFYKVLNEPKEILGKRYKIKGTRDIKIKKIDDRIEKLMKEKELIYSKGNERQNKLLDNLPEIEYKPVDISMDLSELKNKVVSGDLR